MWDIQFALEVPPCPVSELNLLNSDHVVAKVVWNGIHVGWKKMFLFLFAHHLIWDELMKKIQVNPARGSALPSTSKFALSGKIWQNFFFTHLRCSCCIFHYFTQNLWYNDGFHIQQNMTNSQNRSHSNLWYEITCIKLKRIINLWLIIESAAGPWSPKSVLHRALLNDWNFSENSPITIATHNASGDNAFKKCSSSTEITWTNPLHIVVDDIKIFKFFLSQIFLSSDASD